MAKPTWKEAAEILGIIAIVASLVFVGIQLRQDQEIAEAQIYLGATANVAVIAQTIADNERLWRRGLDGEDLSPDERATFNSILRAVYQRDFGLFARGLRLDLAPPKMVIRRVALNAFIYPGYRQFLVDRRSETAVLRESLEPGPGREFDRLVLEELQRFDELAPAIPTKTYAPY